MRHADLLAAHKVEFSKTTHPTLQSVLSQAATVGSEVRMALQAAAARWETIRSRRTLTLLMILDAEEIESEVADALEATGNGSIPWRVSRFSRTGQTFGENEMMLLGLVGQKTDAWEQLADVYAWGRLAVRHPLILAGGRIPSPDYVPVLEITLWNGRSEPETISVQGDRGKLPGAALAQTATLRPRAVRELMVALDRQREKRAPAEVRSGIAGALLARAQTWRADSEHWSRWTAQPDRWAWEEIGQQLRLLETACFFDPQNRAAGELLLRIRWDASRESAAPNRFWFSLKCSEAWGSYVERFGLTAASISASGPEVDLPPTPAEYVHSISQLVSIAALGNKEDSGFPRDMSGHVARKWLAGFAGELTKRVLKTADQPTTKSLARSILQAGLAHSPQYLMMVEPKSRQQCIEAFWPAFLESVPPGSRQQDFPELCASLSATYAQLGLAGHEKPMLALLDKPEDAKPQTPVRLPRVSESTPLKPYLPADNQRKQ